MPVMHNTEKEAFFRELGLFAGTLAYRITSSGEWNIRGFIDIFRNVYTLSSDSKVLSKVLEIHLLPNLLHFAEAMGYSIEPAEKQNWYPDFTFISKQDNNLKFAVDLKTTYRNRLDPDFCNGFTLGSHGEYSGHFCYILTMTQGFTLSAKLRIYLQ